MWNLVPTKFIESAYVWVFLVFFSSLSATQCDLWREYIYGMNGGKKITCKTKKITQPNCPGTPMERSVVLIVLPQTVSFFFRQPIFVSLPHHSLGSRRWTGMKWSSRALRASSFAGIFKSVRHMCTLHLCVYFLNNFFFNYNTLSALSEFEIVILKFIVSSELQFVGPEIEWSFKLAKVSISITLLFFTSYFSSPPGGEGTTF